MSRRHRVSLGSVLSRVLFTLGLPALVWALVMPEAIGAQAKRATERVVKAPHVTKAPHVVKRKVVKPVLVTKRKSVAYAARPSFGQIAGLHSVPDALALKSRVALVLDQDTREVLFSKNDQAVLPIASLTKLMTGLLISEARLPMDEMIMIDQSDVDTEKGSRSRLRVGAQLSRGELLHLALMSSENRAAHALGRTYPGGLPVFVDLMNSRARTLGMGDTRYVEPTGLSSQNQSSARDLAKLVGFSYGDPVLRALSTSPEHQVAVGSRTLTFNNTNRLVKNASWDIGIQKTGYISEAGQCLVMQAKVAGRKLIMVFLDSAGKLTRLGDAERVRRWVESKPAVNAAAAPLVVRADAGPLVVGGLLPVATDSH